MNTHHEPPHFVSRQVSKARRFFLELSPGKSVEPLVVCGGCERVQPDYIVRRKTFSYLCVEFVTEGKGRLQLATRKFTLEPGTVFAYGPQVPHQIETDPSHVMTKYYVDFVGDHPLQLMEHVGLAPGNCRLVSQPFQLQELFELLLRYGSSGTRFASELCNTLVPTLLYKIGELERPSESYDPRAYSTYLNLKQAMDEDCLSYHNIDDLARACRVSPSYVCRLFRRFDQVTPYQYLTRQKMGRGAQMLLDRGIRVKQVAERLGFDDSAQFSRAFKRVYGLSPTEFLRRQAR